MVCLVVASCGTGVDSPWQSGSTDQALDASVPTDAGVPVPPADAGQAPTSCQDNDDCWFGDGCYAQRCIDPLLLEGNFERRPITNEWHRVAVQVIDRELEWSNAADVAWGMEFRDGTLWTMSDCPYGVQELVLDIEAHLITGIRFQSELYQRVD
jgi:hypothetical protein